MQHSLFLWLGAEGAVPGLQWDGPGAQCQESSGATLGAVSELR